MGKVYNEVPQRLHKYCESRSDCVPFTWQILRWQKEKDC